MSTFVKWTVFWSIVCACFAFSAGSYAFSWVGGIKIADAIVCNDRLRQEEDKIIRSDVQGKVDVINKDMERKFDRLQSDITDIKLMLARKQ
jgi:hypothetical protein